MNENIEEDFIRLVKEKNFVRDCAELSQKMRGRRNGVIYFTENFRMEFENKMYKIRELQKENEELKEKYDIDIHELENLLSDTEVEMLDWRNKCIKLEAENRELKTF